MVWMYCLVETREKLPKIECNSFLVSFFKGRWLELEKKKASQKAHLQAKKIRKKKRKWGKTRKDKDIALVLKMIFLCNYRESKKLCLFFFFFFCKCHSVTLYYSLSLVFYCHWSVFWKIAGIISKISFFNSDFLFQSSYFINCIVKQDIPKLSILIWDSIIQQFSSIICLSIDLVINSSIKKTYFSRVNLLPIENKSFE